MQSRLTTLLNYALQLFLFLLPWPTIWIYKEQMINGAKWEYGTLGFYATEGLLWVCIMLFVGWYISKLRGQLTRWKFTLTRDRIFFGCCLIFILFVMAGEWWAPNQDLASLQALRVMEALLLFVMLFFGPVRFSSLLPAFVFGSVIQSVLGIGQFLLQTTTNIVSLGLVSHPVWQAGTSIIAGEETGRWLRAYGSFTHPNVFGGFLVIALLATVRLLGRTTESRWRLVYTIAVLIQLTALFFTFSRSAWLAAGIGAVVAVVYALHKKYHQYYLPLISVFCLLSLLSWLFFPLINTRLTYTAPHERQSVTERVTGYEAAWQLWRAQPWVGVGIGNYTAALYAEYRQYPGWWYQPVHNVFLLFITELGVVGVTLFGGVIGSFIELIRRTPKMFKVHRSKFLIVSTIIAPLLFFDHYLFSSFQGLILGIFFWKLVFHISSTELST